MACQPLENAVLESVDDCAADAGEGGHVGDDVDGVKQAAEAGALAHNVYYKLKSLGKMMMVDSYFRDSW